MKNQTFEELRCWQAARQLVKLVFIAAQSGALARDFETKYQLKKAALSSMNNIAEGYGRFGSKDAIKFYNISQSSVLEVKSILYVLSDMQYLSESQIEEIRMKADETRNLTLAYIKYKNNRTGEKTSSPTQKRRNRTNNEDGIQPPLNPLSPLTH